jgi:thiol-disulfide isomerase/thioredoxin
MVEIKRVIKDGERYMKVLWAIPIFIFTTTGFAQPDIDEKMRQIYSLTRENKYEEVLEIVEQALSDGGDTRLLQVKFTILSAMGRHREVLETALEQDKLAVSKLPLKCLDIAGVYLTLKEPEKALDWLEEAVNRGFANYRFLAHPSFDLVRETERFQTLERCVKGIHGIGKPAKDFTVKMLSGDLFTLSSQKGRVVLIDFWATWCRPCLREIPRMKSIYAEYQDKGFEIIGVSLDRREKDVVKYVQDMKLGWKISYSGSFWSDPTAKLYGVNKIPSKWLVDREGILRGIDLSGEALEKAIIDLI